MYKIFDVFAKGGDHGETGDPRLAADETGRAEDAAGDGGAAGPRHGEFGERAGKFAEDAARSAAETSCGAGNGVAGIEAAAESGVAEG